VGIFSNISTKYLEILKKAKSNRKLIEPIHIRNALRKSDNFIKDYLNDPKNYITPVFQ
jgi:hypothetical protein